MHPTTQTRNVSELSFGDLIHLLADTDKEDNIDLLWRMMLIQREPSGKLKVGFRV